MMEGVEITTIYLTILLIGGGLTLLYLLFGDILDGLMELSPGSIINPTVALSFISIVSGTGYILEKMTSLDSLSIFIVAVLVGLLLVSLLHFFVLLPLSKVEGSVAFSIYDLVGKVGKVIISIPENGFGEVVVRQEFSVNAYPAESDNGQPIEEGTEVLVVEVKDHTLLVINYSAELNDFNDATD